MIKATATPQVPLECTSAAVIGAALTRAGLHRDDDVPTILPILYILAYTRTNFGRLTSRQEGYVFHYRNGAVASLLCSGVVAKTLDPVIGVCLDVGPSTRTDRAAVRAWALRAQATITKSPKARPVLTSGRLRFVACTNPAFPKASDAGLAFQMNVFIEPTGPQDDASDCSR